MDSRPDFVPREPSRDTSLASWPEEQLLRIRFPFTAHSASYDSRFGAIGTDNGIACVDLKYVGLSGKAKLLAVFPSSVNPVLSLNHSRLAVGGPSAVRIIDLASGTVDLKLQYATHRARNVTAIDWSSDPNVLAAATSSGSVQLWDVRSPVAALNHSTSAVVLESRLIRFNRFTTDYVLASAHGDAVVLWDYRSTKYPIRSVAGAWRTPITGLDWTSSSGDLMAVSGLELMKFRDCSSVQRNECNQQIFALSSLPALSGGALVAVSLGSRVELLDPTTCEPVDRIELESSSPVTKIGFLDETCMLCMHSADTLTLRSVARQTTSWSIDGHSSESSPKIQPVSSSDVSTADLTAEDPTRAALARLARRLRRLYLEAEAGADLEVTLEDEAAKLKIILNIDKATLHWEVWWAAHESIFAPEEGSAAPLPDPAGIQADYLATLTLDDILAVDPSVAVAAFRRLRDGVATKPPCDMAPVAAGADDSLVPFPATCGVCWSPTGNLFRFHSLKGLSPWPKNRERLTMVNFHRLSQENDRLNSRQGAGLATSRLSMAMTDSAAQSIRLNTLCEYIEPISGFDGAGSSSEPADENGSDCTAAAAAAETDDARDAEFNRRVTTDQCVQFLPAAVFEELVEDHWFAMMAPVVAFERSAAPTARAMRDFTRQFAHKNLQLLELVHSAWELMVELLACEPHTNSGLSIVAQSVIEHKIRELYAAEQTQTIAVIAGLILRSKSMVGITHPGLLQAVCLIAHDHAVLFQRLGCFASSRVLENIQHEYMPDHLPLLLDQKGSFFASAGGSGTKPTCSVCCVPVHGMGQFCLRCGHGGHLRHMDGWWSSGRASCAVSQCDCACTDPSASAARPVSATFIPSLS